MLVSSINMGSHSNIIMDNRSKKHVSSSPLNATNAASKRRGTGTKSVVTIRLDTDILEWFRSGGPGYQTRVNSILCAHMAMHIGSELPAFGVAAEEPTQPIP